MVTLLIGSACAAALVILGIVLFQHRLLYFPTRASVGDLTGGDLSAWPEPQDFRGLKAEPRQGAGPPLQGTAVVFHGNAGHAGHRAYYASSLTALGLRVILAEYPGYGPREGKIGEASFVADAEDTIALAHRHHGEPLLVIGESLGAAVAAAAAGRHPDKIAALMLITPWDRLESVGAHHSPWLPVRWLLNDRYDSVESLKSFSGPVLVMLAEHDAIVPARFGRTLFDGLAQPRALRVVPDAGHNDWIGRVDAAWWTEAITWLLAARMETAGGNPARADPAGSDTSSARGESPSPSRRGQ